jgi:hypothetical protein
MVPPGSGPVAAGDFSNRAVILIWKVYSPEQRTLNPDLYQAATSEGGTAQEI